MQHYFLISAIFVLLCSNTAFPCSSVLLDEEREVELEQKRYELENLKDVYKTLKAPAPEKASTSYYLNKLKVDPPQALDFDGESWFFDLNSQKWEESFDLAFDQRELIAEELKKGHALSDLLAKLENQIHDASQSLKALESKAESDCQIEGRSLWIGSNFRVAESAACRGESPLSPATDDLAGKWKSITEMLPGGVQLITDKSKIADFLISNHLNIEQLYSICRKNLTPKYLRNKLKSALTKSTGSVEFAINDKNQLVGFSLVKTRLHQKPSASPNGATQSSLSSPSTGLKENYIEAICTDPSTKGLGRDLLKNVENSSDLVTLNSVNTALGFYRHIGYEFTHDLPNKSNLYPHFKATPSGVKILSEYLLEQKASGRHPVLPSSYDKLQPPEKTKLINEYKSEESNLPGLLAIKEAEGYSSNIKDAMTRLHFESAGTYAVLVNPKRHAKDSQYALILMKDPKAKNGVINRTFQIKDGNELQTQLKKLADEIGLKRPLPPPPLIESFPGYRATFDEVEQTRLKAAPLGSYVIVPKQYDSGITTVSIYVKIDETDNLEHFDFDVEDSLALKHMIDELWEDRILSRPLK